MSAGPPPLLFCGPPRRIPFAVALVFGLLLTLIAAAVTDQDPFQAISSKQNGSLVPVAGLWPSDNVTATATTPRGDNNNGSDILDKPLLNETTTTTTTTTPTPKEEEVISTPSSSCTLAPSTPSTPAATTSSTRAKTVVTVGYLTAIKGTLNDRQGLAISGALTLALEEVNDSPDILPHVHLDFRWNDTKGETVTTTQVITEMICQGVAAFFGPEGTCLVESIVAQSRNIPMISYKCPEYRASKNEVFARTEPPDMQATKSLIALLNYYKWHKFSIIAEEAWRPVADALRSEAVSSNMTINHFEMVVDRYTCCEEKYPCCQTTFWYGKITETRNRTRIYVFLGSSSALIDMMDQMNGLQMFDQGEYIVIYVDKMTYSPKEAMKYLWKSSDVQNPKGCSQTHEFERKARSLIVVVPSPPNAGYESFAKKVRIYNSREPFFFPSPPVFTTFQMFISMYAAYLYDSVKLYARALDDLLKQESVLNETVINEVAKNGTRIIQTIINYKTYQSISGATIKLDKQGDSEGNFSVLMYRNISLNLGTFNCSGQMYPVGRFVIDSNELIIYQLKGLEQSQWMFGGPPIAEPVCGFNNENCSTDSRKSSVIAAGTLAVLLFCATVVTISIYRKWKIEQEIEGLLWKIKHEDLHGYFGKDIVSSPSKLSLASANSYESRCGPQVFATTGNYRNVMVRIKELKFSKRKDIARDIMKEMRVLRDLRHDNINSFIGACLEPMRILIITDYCAKGSLYDIVENEDIKLDIMFIASLVHDLIKGMVYLHQSALGCHGNLKSSNCVVTSRWVLQVTDFGLHELRHCAESESIGEHQYFRNLFWKAPELLRDPNAPVGGTQKGDVYAFAIVVYEIFGRRGPFGVSGYEPKEIIDLVKHMPGENDIPFRPNLEILRESDSGCAEYILSCIQDCWHENPELRPDFPTIRSRLKKMKDGMHRNIVDHMMAIMEKYADNLEDLVSERTRLLYEEKQKTEDLLHRMLPAPVASRLTLGIGVEPESFDLVTIYFSDIVGFTAMSAESSPLQVVNFLNDLYTLFDRIIKGYDVYKVETIGDAYMVVSGLPLKNGDKHAGEIASMSLDLLSAIKSHRIAHRPNETLKLRIGIHTGPVVAGVVGLTMPRYCLFGDTVNTASRMESNGEPLKIHISPQCKDALDRVGGYVVNERGMVYMKGKGEVKTYWLIGATECAIQRREVDLGELPPLFCRPRRSPKLNSDSRQASISGNFCGGSSGSRRHSAIPRGASVDVESTSTFTTSRFERQGSRVTLDACSPQQTEESKMDMEPEQTSLLPRLLRESRSLDPFPVSDSRFVRVSSRQPLTRSLENCLETSECFNPKPSPPTPPLSAPLTNGNVIIPPTSQDEEELIIKSELPGPQTTDNGLTSSGEDIETPLLNRANEAMIISGNCHMRRGRSGCGESTTPELITAKRWKSLDQVPVDNIPPGLGQNKKLLERGSIRSWLFGLFNRNGLRTSDASLRKGIHSGYTDLQAEKESIV